VAPGTDLERDIFARMGFRPNVSESLREMDPRLFRDEPVGLASELATKAPRARSARLEKLEVPR
jgi:propionate CoA-transferase